jgi:dTDP-4-dehydrorhamnose reductase
MKILITGGSGQVGFELVRHFCLHGKVLAPDRRALDLSDARAVDTWLTEHQPDLILNAAAYTAVDKAESEPELANRLNAELPAQLAAYAASRNILLVHYSSDYVYPGTDTQPWQENSPTGPLSVYGQTKLAGDQAVVGSGCAHLIFRTSWVYSARGNNFMKTMLRLARERTTLNVVADQIGAPTPARLIALVTVMAVERDIASGIYHLAPRGETSWHGFAQAIFSLAREAGETLALAPEGTHPIPTSDYPTPAQRPLNSRLDLQKLERALGTALPDWRCLLTQTVSEYLH